MSIAIEDDGDVHTAHVIMPSILDSKEGTIMAWLKAEGDAVKDGESLCQVEVGDMIIEISAPFAGVLADIIAEKNQVIKTAGQVAVVCDSKESYLNYIEEARIKHQEEERLKQVTEVKEEKIIRPSSGSLLREIKHMLDAGKLDAVKDAQFVAALQALARKGHPELLAAFEAAFEGSSFNIDTFDVAFFLDNARAVVQEQHGGAAAAPVERSVPHEV